MAHLYQQCAVAKPLLDRSSSFPLAIKVAEKLKFLRMF